MRRKWLRLSLVLLAALFAGSFGVSLALRGGWAHRNLLARLSSGFGRPVEVGRFGFSLLTGPRLKAQSVTVYDDPRFGYEYFLRADELRASVRWTALIRGRFEFDTVALTRPSLNLVRLSDGQWNIESWLPPLPSADPVKGSGSEASVPAVARLSRIEVDEGRINFKSDSRKLPLALIAVTGRFDHDAAGHWNIDVQAKPMRAPASLQQAGTLRASGTVGGVSTRLRPASLALSWEDASLADLSRLAQGGDYGLRGTLSAEMTARIDDAPAPASGWGEWTLDGKVRLQGVHGWALAGRPGDPSANVNFQGRWRPAEYRLMVDRYLMEAPRSRLEGDLEIDWSRGVRPQARITSARLGLADVVAWRRAFLAGVADDLSVEGTLEAQASLAGWPLRMQDLMLVSTGAVVRSGALPGPLRVGPIVTEWSGETLKVHPVPVFLPVAVAAKGSSRGGSTLDSPPSSSALLLEGAVGPLPGLSSIGEAHYRVTVSGAARRAQDLLAVVRAWNGTTDSSWAAEGPVSLQLAWEGSLGTGISLMNGTVQARGVQVVSALANRPVLLTAATIELRGDQRRIILQSAQAFGAHWTGSLRRPRGDAGWDFDLSADRVNAADLYAWLGAPARPNLLQRMLPFGARQESTAASGHAGALETLRARGRLRAAEFLVSPLHVEKLDSAAVIEKGSLFLKQGRAGLFGGQVTGDFEARLGAEPAYSFEGQLARIDLREVAATAVLPGRFSGVASIDLKLSARGADRAALASSLEGEGSLNAGEALVDWAEPAVSTVASAAAREVIQDNRSLALSGRFQVGSSRIQFNQLVLARPGEQKELTGSVDFARRLNLTIRPRAPRAPLVTGDAASLDAFTVAGTLDAPRVTPLPATAMLAPRAGVPSASASPNP